MKFLISNDDAVHASALQAFAFDTEQSGCTSGLPTSTLASARL